MRPTPLAARKAGAALAALMLSTALTACQPDSSTGTTAPTTAPTATNQVSTPAGNPTDGRKVKGTIHWVSADNCDDITVNLYDHLFTIENTGDIPEGKTFADYINPDSVKTLTGVKAEKALEGSDDTHFQFVRTGYFVKDSKNPGVYNRIVTLKDSYKPE